MGMLTPAFFGLSIFIGGLIIFYMFRKQYTEQVVSANFLWEQIMNEWQATKWWKKLQRQLLLLLQLLILLFLMLALVRPFTESEGMTGEHVIMVLDTSATMAAVVDKEGITRFDQAKAEMQSLLNKRSREQAVSIIAVGTTPHLVVNRETNEGVINEALQEIHISYEYPEFTRSLSLAKALSEQSTASVYVFSDKFTDAVWQESRIDVPFHVRNMGATKADDTTSTDLSDNLSIQTFGVSTDGGTTSAVTTIFNEGRDQRQVSVKFFAEGNPVYTDTITVPGEAEGYLTVMDLPQASFYEVRLLEEDIYPLDNTAYAFTSLQAKPVLYLVGDVNPFLQRVFRQLGHEIIQAETMEDMPLPRENNSIIVATESSVASMEELSANIHTILLLADDGGEAIPLQETFEINRDSALFAYTDLSELYISQARETERPLTGFAETVMWSGETPLIEKITAEGQTMIHLRFQLQDSDWPLYPSFPVFVFNVLESLTERTGHLGYFTPNEQRVLSLEEEGIYDVVDEEGELVGNFDLAVAEAFQAPGKPGLYALVAEDGSRNYFAVTLDEREKLAATALSFSKNSIDDGVDQGGMVQREWWPWFILIAFVIALVEWEVYRRGIRV